MGEAYESLDGLSASKAETAAVVLHYAERCAFSHSELYKEFVRSNEDQPYVTLDRYPKANQVSYGTSKSPKDVGPLVRDHLSDLYEDDLAWTSGADSLTWDFSHIIRDDTINPRDARRYVEEEYGIAVEEYLVDPLEQPDDVLSTVERDKKRKHVTPWHEKVPAEEEALALLGREKAAVPRT